MQRQPLPLRPPERRLRHPSARRRDAFTMIEMIIVVAILAIVAGMALPMFGSTDATRVRSAARVLAADLAFAQVESISHGDDPRVVVFSGTGYHIAATSDPDTPITNPVGNQPYTVTFGQGTASEFVNVRITEQAVGGDARLGFGVYGNLDQATDATIRLGCNGYTVTVTVDPTSGDASIGPVTRATAP